MAAIDFPSSPSTNDTHSENGKVWTFNGTSWVATNTGYLGYSGSLGYTGSIGPQGPQGPIGYTGSGGGASNEIEATDDTSTSFLMPVMIGYLGSANAVKVSSTKLYFDANTGTLNATVFNSLSDAAAKINVRDLGYGLDTVLSMNGRKFEMQDTGITAIGLIAQEVEKLVPEVVVEHGEFKGVNYGVLTSILIEAVKELSRRLDTIEKGMK